MMSDDEEQTNANNVWRIEPAKATAAAARRETHKFRTHKLAISIQNENRAWSRAEAIIQAMF